MGIIETDRFVDHALHQILDNATAAELDLLDFGVIGFDDRNLVCRYNTYESHAASLSMERVLGLALFTTVAPCMNNFMVAQRFDDASRDGRQLDTMINYVLTLRMRPVKVRLRLLFAPDSPMRYILVDRRI